MHGDEAHIVLREAAWRVTGKPPGRPEPSFAYSIRVVHSTRRLKILPSMNVGATLYREVNSNSMHRSQDRHLLLNRGRL